MATKGPYCPVHVKAERLVQETGELCRVCGLRIKAGDWLAADDRNVNGNRRHSACTPKVDRRKRRQPRLCLSPV